MTQIGQSILEEAGRIVNGERGLKYGAPEDNFARIADFWNTYLRCTGREGFLTAKDVSPMMRLLKEARLCHSPDHRDSFVDIVGYALTGANMNLGEGKDD